MSAYYTDNPVRDAERYYADLEDDRIKHIIGRCVECGDDVYDGDYTDDDVFDFDGDLVCEDCLRSYCRKHYKKY